MPLCLRAPIHSIDFSTLVINKETVIYLPFIANETKVTASDD